MIYLFVWCGGVGKFFGKITEFTVVMWHPPDLDKLIEIRQNKDLVAAYDWATQFSPTRNGDVYEAVLKYAERYYKEVVDVSDLLDKKADDLMRIAGTVAAALAAAGRIQSLQSAFDSKFIVLAIVCLVLTMIICASTRRPVKKAVPMTIKTVMDIVELSSLPLISNEDEDIDENARKDWPAAWTPTIYVTPSTAQVNAAIAASYHWAVTGTQVVVEWKAKLLKRATFVFCACLFMIVVGFLRTGN